MNNQNNDLNKQPQTLGQIASMPLNDTVSNEMDDFVEPKKSLNYDSKSSWAFEVGEKSEHVKYAKNHICYSIFSR